MNPAPPRLIWIVPKWPLPAIDGARVATCNLLRSLAQQGSHIDLWALSDDGAVIDREQA